MNMVPKLAHSAQVGFRNANAYDRYRPSFPSASVTSLLQQMKVEGLEGIRILDLGAGTGKFTQLLSDRPEKYEILAVEPHAEMRATLEGKKLLRVKVVDGQAESMRKVEDGWADAVICAQV